MSEVHHEIIFFSGHVQGVGFRYTTFQIAKEFEVTGFVANLTDGRVELQAEGKKSAVEMFVSAVDERLHGHIRKAERRGGPRAPQFREFVIK